MKNYRRRYPLIVPLAVFLAAVAVLVRIGPVAAVTAAGPLPQTYTVVVDAGHGGADGGAIGRSGTLEKEITLKIALKTAAFLRLFGVNVVMTRTDDRSLHSPNATTLREQKSEDLKQRCAIVEASKNPLYVAIHQNFFADTVSRGAQAFYAAGNDGGKLMAETLQAHLQAMLPQAGTRDAAKLPNANYIMQHLSCPAVILECGFLSHPEEEMLLCSADYQTALAFCVTAAVLDIARNGAN